MENVQVPLICYCDGELVDEDRNAKYIGGHTKVGMISKTTSFTDFTKTVKEVIQPSSNQMAFDIKCRYRIDEYTVIALSINDNQTLKFIMDQSRASNGIILYIIKRSLTEITLNTGLERGDTPSIETNRTRKVGRPSKFDLSKANHFAGKDEGRSSRKAHKGYERRCRKCGKLGHYKNHCTNREKHCTACGESGHDKRSCKKLSYNVEGEESCPSHSHETPTKHCTRCNEPGHDRRSCGVSFYNVVPEQSSPKVEGNVP